MGKLRLREDRAFTPTEALAAATPRKFIESFDEYLGSGLKEHESKPWCYLLERDRKMAEQGAYCVVRNLSKMCALLFEQTQRRGFDTEGRQPNIARHAELSSVSTVGMFFTQRILRYLPAASSITC